MNTRPACPIWAAVIYRCRLTAAALIRDAISSCYGDCWRLVRRERPDVYLGYTVKPNVYGSLAARALDIPVINNITGLGSAFSRQNWLTLLVRGLYRLALDALGEGVFSERGRPAVVCRRRIGETHERRTVMPGSGVDLERFKPVRRFPLTRADFDSS